MLTAAEVMAKFSRRVLERKKNFKSRLSRQGALIGEPVLGIGLPRTSASGISVKLGH